MIIIIKRWLWLEAKAAAEFAGGHLATIGSEAENLFVYSLIDYDRYWHVWQFGSFEEPIASGPWLGGMQPETVQNPWQGWEWVDGTSWGYTNWAADQPDDSWVPPGEDKLHFWNWEVRGPVWNDVINDRYLDGGIGREVIAYIIEFDEEPRLNVPVEFADTNLKAAVEATLGLSNPTELTMLGLYEFDISGLAISSLDGLEYALMLKQFKMNNTQVRDLEPLTSMTELSVLEVMGNPLDDTVWCDDMIRIRENNPLLTKPMIDRNPVPVPGDGNWDCRVDMDDLMILVNQWMVEN